MFMLQLQQQQQQQQGDWLSQAIGGLFKLPFLLKSGGTSK
jgi:hypothetical protein